MTNSRLAITLGDPAGIGGEVILKALADPHIYEKCDVTVVGSRDLLLETHTKLNLTDNCAPLADPEKLVILDVDLGNHNSVNSSNSSNSASKSNKPSKQNKPNKIIIGEGNAASGAASFAYMETAIDRTLKGEFDGIVTGPIAKSAWKAAGHHYPGQTELLAQKSGVERFGMLFVARSPHTNWTLVTLLATTHIPLQQVPHVLTPKLMTQKLDLLLECLKQDFGIERPKIVVAGLNPHSGEEGQLGHEEQEWLTPWLEQQRQKYPFLQLYGPIPPDTMWVKPGQAWYGKGNLTGAADAYLALYHDQGLIPVKLMAFDRAVNTSIGLPFVRTSPDHGTAFDIAGKGIADATSMKAAIQLASELVSHRRLSFESQG